MDLYQHYPKKTIIPSRSQAEHDWKTWLNANDYRIIPDGDQYPWELSLEWIPFNHVSRDHSNSSHTNHMDSWDGWAMNLILETKLTGDRLIQTKTLDAISDQRLISFLGENQIPITLRPKNLHVKDEAEAKKVLSETLPLFKKEFKMTSLRAKKRQWIAGWIEQQTRFEKRKP